MAFPLILPPDTVSGGIQSIFDGFDVGMVVTGDNQSIYNESYAEVSFLGSNNSSSYDVVVSLWSARLSGGCPTSAAYEFAWNNSVSSSFACMENLMGGGSGLLLASGVAGWQLLNVTFVGNATSGSVLTIYVNDSSQSIADSVVLDNATTGVAGALRPAFLAACADSCVLNWSSEPFGLSFGADLCSTPTCYSYNEATLNSTDPLVLDPPTFYEGTGYSGQYAQFSPMSLTGACNGLAVSGVLCPLGPTSGYYPEFTFNGSQLNFPTQKPWATQNFGSRSQYQDTGGPTDLVPFFLSSGANNSRGGFIAPNTGLNVTVQAQVLGSVANLTVAYFMPDGSSGNLTLNRTNGTASNGYYNGTLPSTGGNGRITFRIWGTDRAGEVVSLPVLVNRPFSVQRGLIPTFHLALALNVPNCGSVEINGTTYTSGQNATLLAGTYALRAQLCYPYVFGHWGASAGIFAPTGASGKITITSNGSLGAFWVWVRPLDTVSVAIANPPSGCGTVVLNGTAYSGAGSVQLLDLENFTLTEQACSLSEFSGWTVTNGSALAILGTNLYLKGNGTITANFIASSQAITLALQVDPAYCPGGGILFRGAGYVNNSQVAVSPGTAYPIEQLPCTNYGFLAFNVTSGITISAGFITATQIGTVTEINYPLTLVTLITVPSFCGGIRWSGGGYSGLYTNGTVLNVTNVPNATAYAVACPGFYPTGLSGTGLVQVIGNKVTLKGSGSIIATFGKGSARVWVGFETSPSSCGEILFGNVAYRDTNYTYVGPDTSWSLSALPCAGEGFVGWSTLGLGISIVGSTATINGPGSIRAIFHPLAIAYLYTLPSSCGGIELAGTNYTNGATVEVPEGLPVTIHPLSCLGYGFTGWENTSDSIVANGSLTLIGSAIITALFVPVKYALTFLVSPASCGGVIFNGAEYFSNSTVYLLTGKYAVSPSPCVGDYLTDWNASAGVTVTAGTEVFLNASGWVEFFFGPIPPTISMGAPTSSYANSPVPFEANVAVPVPPYTYTYTWEFGDGSQAVTPANFTSHVYAHTGVFTVHLLVKDPFGRVAYANATVSIVTAPVVTNFSFPTLDVGVLLLVLAAIGLGILITRRRRSSPSDGPATGTLEPVDPSEPMGGGASPPANLQEDSPIMLDAPPEEPSNPEGTK
ncbi:MAG: PKD domain-containing protein [Thermoplasmata archaeon]